MPRCGGLPLALALLAGCSCCQGLRSAVGSARRPRHHTHRGGRHPGRHWRLAALQRLRVSHKRGASRSGFLNFTETLAEGSLSVGQALEQVPVHAGDLYAQFQATPGSFQAKKLLEELNAVYGRAQTQRDRLGFTCDQRRSDFDRLVRDARASLREAEVQLTLLQERSQKLQLGTDHALAEVNRLQEQYQEHRDGCARSRQGNREALSLLARDLPLARALRAEASQSCAGSGGSPPPLVECSLPDRVVVTFKDASRRQKAAGLSALSERLLALNLDRTARGHGRAAAPTTVLLRGGRARVVALAARRSVHRRVRRLRRRRRHRRRPAGHRRAAPILLQLSRVPDSLCADILTPPACGMFVDDLGTFVGNVEDLASELKVRAEAEEKHCQDSLDAYEGQVQALKHQADSGNVELVNALAEKSTLEAARRERREQLARLSREARHGLEECGRELGALSATMCGARRLRADLGPGGAFLGDCEVSDWAPGPCSKTCGGGGTQNLTRQVVRAPQGQQRRCPALVGSRACNERPCPVDGLMGRWGPWSQCSRACGGGVKTRSRRALREPRNGGLPNGETVQERICNPQPCDEDCALFPWSDWSPCSKACSGGHRARGRRLRRPALGEGSCPAEDATERHEVQPCGRRACAEAPAARCNSSLDLVFALDASGSAGAAGVVAARGFAMAAAARLGLGGGRARAGAVYFGDSAEVAHALTADVGALKSGLAFLPQLGTGTNSGEGLALAGQLLERDGRRGVRHVVAIVTDGMPLSSYVMSTAAKRLKSRGVRVVFVLVGPGLSKQAVKGWASQPAEENLVKAQTYADLNQTKVTELLANLCPDFA